MGLNGARIGLGIVVNDFQNSLPFVTDQIMSFQSSGTTLFDPLTFDFGVYFNHFSALMATLFKFLTFDLSTF